MTAATYGCWQVSPKPLPFFLSDLFRPLSLIALVFDDCMENDTWVMWDRHRTGESKGGCDLRNPNPKPETDSESWFQGTKPENPKPETDSESCGFRRRNPKPETRNRQRKLVSSDETRNPKPETDSESGFQSTKPENPETRNRQQKSFSIDQTRNPKPETDSESVFQSTKPETRAPKPETDSNPTFGWLSGSELFPRYFQFDHSHQDFPSLDPEFQSLSPQ